MNGQRSLETPSRSRMRSRDEAGPSQTRSRSGPRQSRMRELDRDRERVQRLERELQREREILLQRERSSRQMSTERPRDGTRRCRGDNERREGIDHGRRTSHARSRSPSFSCKDVAKIIQSLKHGLQSQPLPQNGPSVNKNIDNKNILPNFDPSVKNQRIDMWLRKVNECATVYGWVDRTTIHFALQKLQGLAKTWFESLDTILYTWQKWQDKLINAFPHELNYGQCLEDMLKRKSKFNEPVETYYYEKLSLLNLCDISGKRAVDCIIHGISDRTMRSSALALRCTHPEQLLQFLMSNKDSMNMHQTILFKNRNMTEHANNSSGSVSKVFSRKDSYHGVFCFNCKERGHPYLNCPKPLLKCNRCNKIGHKTENCFTEVGDSTANKGTVQKTMSISNANPNAKFTKEVDINGVVLEAFVDFGSEVTLVKKSIAHKIGKVRDDGTTVIKGFGNVLNNRILRCIKTVPVCDL
ncbi:uncharacterized protein LOC142985783 [Anticarsia gemmatalis]|uniref:uncharacterized protein LOC142985783 n=1 Tax=Anticarsia gemmatalis TaxID=129554 RepID=UPI003F75A7F9